MSARLDGHDSLTAVVDACQVCALSESDRAPLSRLCRVVRVAIPNLALPSFLIARSVLSATFARLIPAIQPHRSASCWAAAAQLARAPDAGAVGPPILALCAMLSESNAADSHRAALDCGDARVRRAGQSIEEEYRNTLCIYRMSPRMSDCLQHILIECSLPPLDVDFESIFGMSGSVRASPR